MTGDVVRMGRGRVFPAKARSFVTELALMLTLFAVYKAGRVLIDQNVGAAMANALHIWDLERALFLPDESALQRWVLEWEPAAFLANLYYVGVHFPGTALLLVWLFVRHRDAYRRVRTELVLLTAAGMVVHMAFPLAPPRLAGFGTVDTMLAVGPSAYPAAADGIANQYAAMPSLHVGWALLVAVAVVRTARGRWRWVVAAHAPVTVLVVVVTANHYWLDGLVAAALLLGAIAATNGLARLRAPARPAATPARIARPARDGGVPSAA
ncbi:hypothetical protein GCM10009678_83070 [Actinomadura kijaniata]|uniref:Inositolphosphotransferase Aur1/Ipt1 domain-containing protein n=1 Tax=Actinomadura namibiensis TaxID=182080 RepID=A0A7W3LQ21_ACTNM|nr:phosphatase PAP2 family protein [Actinomadura namibiensis]MBA8952080.1 hypothetical protein [Actinomadura namibiensis]